MMLFLLQSLWAQEPSDSGESTPAETPEESSRDESGTDSPAEETPVKEGSEEPSTGQQVAPVEEAPAEVTPAEEVPVEEANSKVPQEEASQSSQPMERKRGEVILVNGDVLHGNIYNQDHGMVGVDVGLGRDILVPDESIRSILYPRGKFANSDLGAMRYFYTPSAMPMKKGSGYISQKELLFTAAAYSPSQDWSVLVGTSVPYLLYAISQFSTETLLGVAGIRYGTQISENVYIGGGVESFFIADAGNLSLPFVNATFGDSDQHVTVAAGVGVIDFDEPRVIPLNISAYKRISPSIALVTENWLVGLPSYDYVTTNKPIPYTQCGPNGEPCYEEKAVMNWSDLSFDVMASAIGVRFISRKFTTDVAIVNTFVNGDYIPLPWLDVSWYFDADVP